MGLRSFNHLKKNPLSVFPLIIKEGSWILAVK